MRSSPALPTSLYALLMLCAGRLDERTATAQILVENAEQRAVSYVESGARIPAASRASGASAEVSSEIVWRPMCGSPAGALTRDDLRRIAESQRQMSNAAGAAVTAAPLGTLG